MSSLHLSTKACLNGVGRRECFALRWSVTQQGKVINLIPPFHIQASKTGVQQVRFVHCRIHHQTSTAQSPHLSTRFFFSSHCSAFAHAVLAWSWQTLSLR